MRQRWWAAALLCLGAVHAAACAAPSAPDESNTTPAATGGRASTSAQGGAPAGSGGAVSGTGGTVSGAGGTGGTPTGSGGAPSPAPPDAGEVGGEVAPVGPPAGGPNVDRSDNKERAFTFKASDADPAATKLLGTQQAFLDTRVAPRGLLVVHLHGSGEKVVCGYTDHGKLLASWGFHVFMPCYDAAVSWSNGGCGGAVGTCRLEMLDGTDHSGNLTIAPAQSIEGRMVAALLHLQKADPKGDWGYYLEGEKPRWPRIIISGQSFGATSSLLIAKHRLVARAVALSGPLDGGAAWLKQPSLTPIDRMFAFTHVSDGQHPTHKGSIGAIGLGGAFVEVEKVASPYEGSHRLVGGMTTFGGAPVDGHNATEARVQSPKDPATGKYVYEPVWSYLYGVTGAP